MQRFNSAGEPMLSTDQQQLLWSEQSASISRLHKRIEQQQDLLTNFVEMLTLVEERVREQEQAMQTTANTLLKRLAALEASCEFCLKEGRQ